MFQAAAEFNWVEYSRMAMNTKQLLCLATVLRDKKCLH